MLERLRCDASPSRGLGRGTSICPPRRITTGSYKRPLNVTMIHSSLIILAFLLSLMGALLEPARAFLISPVTRSTPLLQLKASIPAAGLFAVAGSTGSNNNNRKRQQQQRNPTHSAVNQEGEESQSSMTYRINLQLAELANQCARRRSVPKALLALELLRQMKHPDTVAYNSVIKAFAKISPATNVVGRWSAAEKSEILLQEMKDLHAEQRAANQDWYVVLSKDTMDDEKVAMGPPAVLVKPNVRSYCTVMDAYARNGNTASAEKVEALLEDLQSSFKETGDGSLNPNLIAYNTVLAAWSKAGGSVERCEELLKDMPLAPDVISYNAVLHAIASSGSPDAGERAESLLRSMWSVHPNGRTYTTCMNAWSQCGRPDKAQALLYEMKEIYEKTHDVSLEPNCVSYATVIHAYAVSRDHDKAMKAYAIFQDMIQNGVEPNRVTYNNLLNCCASSTTHPELIDPLIDLVEDLYLEVLEQKNPDQYTFGTVLKACSNLLWKDKEFAPSVFREACSRGQVSRGVLWQFRQAVPIDTYREIVGTDHITHSDLPADWTRNVPQDRRRRWQT
jgi:pentatricopeptide repeat protein